MRSAHRPVESGCGRAAIHDRSRRQSLVVTVSLFVFVLVYLSLIAIFAGMGVLAFNELADFPHFDGHGAGRAPSAIIFLTFVGLSFGLTAFSFVKGFLKAPRH